MTENHDRPEIPTSGDPGVDGRPGPDWTPTPLSGTGAPSPAPIPGTPVSSVDPDAARARLQIERYAPRRTFVPLLVGVIGLVIAVLIGFAATRPDTTTPAPAPSTSRSPSAHSSPRAGTPFTVQTTGATGIWKITERRWTDQGVAAHISVTVDSGEVASYFLALSNSGQEAVRGQTDGVSQPFPSTTVTAGQTVNGWVFFPIERGTTLIFLRTRDQAQVSGIEITG